VTYQELYIQSLEARINAGGKQEDVDKAVNEYNAPSREGFDAWLKAVQKVPCSTCGDRFQPDGQTPSQEILCKTHAPKLEIAKS
jgi:hypothetical protein